MKPTGVLGCASSKRCTISPVKSLKAIDLSPWHLPAAEVRCQLIGGRNQSLQSHVAGHHRRGKFVFVSRGTT